MSGSAPSGQKGATSFEERRPPTALEGSFIPLSHRKMADMDSLKTRVPDVELKCAAGASINPSHLAGHDLIILFAPGSKSRAADELEEYYALSDRLAYYDAYMIAVCHDADKAPLSRLAIATDPMLEAWRELSRSERRFRHKDGAVFLFGRGGCLRQSWEGPGHAREVFAALEERG